MLRPAVRTVLAALAALLVVTALQPAVQARPAALHPVTVTFAANPKTVDAGSQATLSGTVKPFHKGATVSLQKLVGSKWVTATTTLVDAKGKFSKKVTVNESSIFRALAQRSGSNAAAASQSKPVITNPVIATSSLKDGFVGGSYSMTLKAVGGTAGTWSASPLPAGLKLNKNTGVITGKPTTAKTTQVKIGFTQAYTGSKADPKTLPLKVVTPVAPQISTASLPDGTIGVDYSKALTAAGGATGTWTASPLPAGLTLKASTGVISGTPKKAGTTSVTIGFTQSGNPKPAKPVVLSLEVVTPKPVITTTSLPDAKIGHSYSATLQVSGDVSGTWTVTGLNGTGLKVNKTTGRITGTALALVPTTAHLTVRFTDSSGQAADPVQLTIRIANS